MQHQHSPYAENYNDQELLQLMASGDYHAFTAIYHRYIKLLSAYGLKFTSNRSAIKDCLHDLFIWLWTNREKISIQYSLKAYLIKAFRTSLFKILKKQRSADMLEESDDYPFYLTVSSEELYIESEEQQMLKYKLEALLKNLTPKQREVIYLRYQHGLSFDEIAEHMQLSVKACYKLMGRAISELRKISPASGTFIFLFLK